MKTKVLSLLALALVLYSCNKNTEAKEDVQVQALKMEDMDTIHNPTEDFYQYTNGGWLKHAQIPDGYGSWSSFNELRDYNDSITLSVLKNAMNQDLKAGSDEEKASVVFEQYLNDKQREEVGLKPLDSYLAEIEALNSLAELDAYNLKNDEIGGNNLYGLYVSAHPKRSTENTLYFGGVALGMGRDYYQKEDKVSVEKLKKYEDFTAKMLRHIGYAETETATVAKNIVALEKQFAKAMLTNVESRNPENRYNPMSLKDLDAMVKSFNLSDYVTKQLPKADSVIVGEINLYKKLDAILAKTNFKTIKDYYKWNVLKGSTGLLTPELEKENFSFYSTTLRGIDKMRPAEKRALARVNGPLGEAVGKLYVKEAFPPAAKDSAKVMISYLRKSFEKHIKELPWMSAVTKEKALDKLNKIVVKIGYPDDWKDYSKLEISKNKNFFENMSAVQKFYHHDNLKDFGKPVDKKKWYMSPQTVNAYYNPPFNEIVFPAAILQSPFYNFKADAAVNFGGIGAVIGHEISHGFDDSGAKYDGDGNLNNWWTPEDEAKFKKLGDQLVAQYEKYEVLPGQFVNGRLTLGENIGDLGGVAVAYDAYRMYVADHGEPELIDSFSGDERFFISWSTLWKTKSTDESLSNKIKTDPHSPGMFRSVGPLYNVDGFHKTFKTKEGNKMFKKEEERIKIW